MKSMSKDGRREKRTWSRRDWRGGRGGGGGGGGGVAFEKLLLPRGLQFSSVIILGGG